MQVTIIRAENIVNMGGMRHTVDCSRLDASVHVVQWDGERGEVEYANAACAHCGTRSKKPNTAFDDFSPYLWAVDGWRTADNAAKAAAAAEIAKQEAAAREHAEAVAKAEQERAERSQKITEEAVTAAMAAMAGAKPDAAA